jgi:glycine cleavage system H protein
VQRGNECSRTSSGYGASVKDMGVPVDLRYSTDHEWVRLNGRVATVGITEYAQDALGDIVYVQIPPIGGLVEAGATITEVESTKSVSDIYAPLAGTVSGFNSLLESQPELINSSPYDEGWLCTLDLDEETIASAYHLLLDAAAYDALIGG